MAHHQHEHPARNRGLKLDIHTDEQRQFEHDNVNEQHFIHRPSYISAESQETIARTTATPPIEIPGQHGDSVAVESPPSPETTESYVNRFLRERETAISFNDEVKTDSGHRHSILEPPHKPVQHGQRGRAMAYALREPRNIRAHSESDRSHYDPETGRHLPQYSDSPPSDQARVGEARFPLLQQTVDELARQHSRDVVQPMSMTSESTVSPVEEAVLTPRDNPTSPIGIVSPFVRNLSSSYGSLPRPRSQRKASERWRDGEAAPDFFSRAGSLRKGDRRSTRRDTQGSTKSPQSAASSFLRGFSISSGDDAPPPVDAEGATIGEDYVLGKQIGYGGFSIIREVKQISSQSPGGQRTLAVKIVKKNIDGKTKPENDLAQAEFEHEVDLWRFLNHKHILSLEAVYELKEATFCFVPLNTGGTLFDVLSHNRQGLSADLAANYSYQLASALRYLHLDARVVHRDVKLENCLVDRTRCSSPDQPGVVRLCDFGLAEWINTDTDSNTSSSPSSTSDRDSLRQLNKYFGPADSSTSAFAGGSLEYTAPEVLRIATSASGRVDTNGQPPEKSIVSTAADIWAMGVCLFALITGRRPFRDSFQPRVVMAILAGDYNKESLKEKTSNAAYKLVKSCLNMDANRRPGINEVMDCSWFDEAGVRDFDGTSDAGSESARASGWRL